MDDLPLHAIATADRLQGASAGLVAAIGATALMIFLPGPFAALVRILLH